MEHEGTATTMLSERPSCDICKQRPAAIDGRTRLGSAWAYLCVPCHESYGVGLGPGRGQRIFIDP